MEDFNEKELRAWVSDSAEEINKILKDEGFELQLRNLKPGETAFLSILKILLKWLNPGIECTIQSPGDTKSYLGVEIEEGFQVINSVKTDNPIICVNSENGDQVFMTIADEELKDFDLFEKIKLIHHNSHVRSCNTSTVRFPMVDFDQQPDISWLQGMKHPEAVNITRAMQQTKFKMNEKGALLESAAVIVTYKCGPITQPTVITINQPFYLWIKRPRVSLPILCAYMDTDVWSKPDLDIE
ncbi:hypothetical protein ACFL08_02440 [Patescibacteria group bacterium]